MRFPRFIRRFIPLVFLLLIGAGAFAQAPPAEGEYQPEPGQVGKDVIWLPTELTLTETMLNLAQVTAQDYVIDLGSGDGRIVIMAAKRGARALGIEYNPDLVSFSKRNAAREGVSARAQFVKADIFESDFSEATVITMFLLPDLNLQLRPRVLDLKPGTRVVSNTFDMGDWQPDKEVGLTKAEGCDAVYCRALLWIVPAKVAGQWKFSNGELDLQQQFQFLSGTAPGGGGRVAIAEGRLSGDRISFSIGGARYTGKVSGTAMEGTYTAAGVTAPWRATRVAP
jgi:SAM-dependent methyltransferase